jgi:IS30 family transposase
MKKYKHLTQSKRETIYELIYKKKSLRCIATVVGFNVSSVSRELDKNNAANIYKPHKAQSKRCF